MSVTKEYLENLKNRLQTIINNTRRTIDNIEGTNLFTNLNELTEHDEVYVYKFDNGSIHQTVHIIDVQRFKNELQNIQSQLDEDIGTITNELLSKLDEIKYIKTKKGDKLYTVCPKDDYCPICDFSKIGQLSHNFDVLNNPDIRLSPDMILFVNSLDTILGLINKNFYDIKNLYLPCILYNELYKKANIKLLKIDRKNSDNLIEELVEHLKGTGNSITDINSFAFKISSQIEQGLYTFDIIDVDEYELDKDATKAKIISELKNKLLTINFGSVIYSNVKFDWIPHLNDIFSKFFEDLKSIIETKMINL